MQTVKVRSADFWKDKAPQFNRNRLELRAGIDLSSAQSEGVISPQRREQLAANSGLPGKVT
jgi:hypothetical protein